MSKEEVVLNAKYFLKNYITVEHSVQGKEVKSLIDCWHQMLVVFETDLVLHQNRKRVKSEENRYRDQLKWVKCSVYYSSS